MAQGVKTMFRIAKKLQESFKLIGFYSSRYLVKSSKYRNQYLNEYKKITGKMKKDSKKERMREKQKYKAERQKLKYELIKLKDRKQKGQGDQEVRAKDKDRHRDRQHRHRDRDRQRHRQRSRQRQKDRESRHHQKDRESRHHQKQRERERSRHHYEREQRKQRQDRPYKQQDERQIRRRQRQYSPDRRSNSHRHEQRQKRRQRQKVNHQKMGENQETDQNKFDIFDSYGPVAKKPKQKSKTKTLAKWSQIQFENLGSLNSEKYKILKVDENESDFEADDAPMKVPFIKPRQPLTPYFLFLRQKRFMIAQSYPDLKEHQMSETLGRVWKNLPAQDKEPYIRQYRRAQKIFSAKLEQYYQMNPQNRSNKTAQLKRIEEAARMSVSRKSSKKDGQRKPKTGQSSKKRTKKKNEDQK